MASDIITIALFNGAWNQGRQCKCALFNKKPRLARFSITKSYLDLGINVAQSVSWVSLAWGGWISIFEAMQWSPSP
jgi:hypothetical protein